MNEKRPLSNRSERSGNLAPIVPYDNTSKAYSKDSSHSRELGFGAYLSVAFLVLLVIFFAGIYELVVETWSRIK